MSKLLHGMLMLALLVAPFAVYGQESESPAADQPSTAEAPAADTGGVKAEEGALVVEVEEVAGTVEIQSGGQGDWVPAVAGMRFGEGTNVCTGFKSGAILQFGDS
ncbi:MAG: hypothetical protein RDV41_15610, partial [Planctomycetota bacterium]|nr:hypothetical protein [Planctomycetota bacterium]